MNEKILLSVLPFISIIHHIEGRVRLRINKDIKNKIQNLNVENLKSQINKIQGIKDMRFNPINGSLTINYDKNNLKPEFVSSLFSGNLNKEVITFLDNLKV